MPNYGSLDHVKKMLRPNETTSYGADIDTRLTVIQKAVSRRMEQELYGTLGAPVSDTTQLIYAGPEPTLILPIPARVITSVTVNGTVSGGTVTGGTDYPASLWAHDPVDAYGRIRGLRLLSGLGWGVASPAGTPLTPVAIVGDFTDTDDDGEVPDDVEYAANLLILRHFQRENTGVAGVSGEDGGFSPPLDPWKDPFVKGVIARYRVRRVAGF